jgi:hypothetical protein
MRLLQSLAFLPPRRKEIKEEKRTKNPSRPPFTKGRSKKRLPRSLPASPCFRLRLTATPGQDAGIKRSLAKTDNYKSTLALLFPRRELTAKDRFPVIRI